jgi:hypothetical protein
MTLRVMPDARTQTPGPPRVEPGDSWGGRLVGANPLHQVGTADRPVGIIDGGIRGASRKAGQGRS